ncbi:hypothetical protein A3860_26790 [Niastella vici]|uniref:Ig-like domain-containing protein n=1 Tax=Niastella vici TaxID=1703345 RepID=A0A1V9FW96_9BACT|nr:hypothetical protein [Niastella vici]OQP62621.1 hypothetical protein A3860_26790 [Niastella vici]
MKTQQNLIELIYRRCTNGKRVWLTLVGLVLAMGLRAQCPGCDVSVSAHTIWYAATTHSDANWGYNPWGVNPYRRNDPEFTENGGIIPNNDGILLAGYDFVSDAVTWCPYYNDKLFYYDPEHSFTRSWRIPAYPISKISQTTPIDKVFSRLGIIFTTGTTWNDPCTPQDLWITPSVNDGGKTTTINEVLYGHENAKTFCGEHYNLMRSFNYTVELPKWNANAADFLSVCQDAGTTYYLPNYFSVSGVNFNVDNQLDTAWQFPDFPDLTEQYQYDHGMYTVSYPQIWVTDWSYPGGGYYTDDLDNPIYTYNYPDFPNYTQDYQRSYGMYSIVTKYITTLNPADLSPGVHTIYASKTYDNGAYDGTFGSHRGEVQFPFTITILPAAPIVGNVSVTPSCPGAPNGTVTISGVSGGDGNYRYILRNGAGNTTACDPEQGTCFDVSAWGRFSGGAYTITGIGEGEYTLWIANAGNTTGACARTYPVSVTKLSVMDTLPITIQHISCPGGNNGLIQVTDTGGLAPYTFTLTAGSNTITNATGEFKTLLAGTYTMSTSDGCGHLVQRTIALSEPLPVTITTTASATDCNNPANGALEVTAAGGSNTFDYYLYDNSGNTVAQQLASTATTWQIPALGAGNYTVSVKNTAAASCAATEKPITIDGPPALVLTFKGKTNNTCSYDALGTLALEASGGQQNGYIFFIRNNLTNVTLQSTTGNFSNLPAAPYTAWVRNADLSCLDSTIYASTIDIWAPPALNIVASATDITCNGKGDGTLQASVGGGTPGYNLQWQLWDAQAANWLPAGRTGLSENNLPEGSYRLLTTDQNNCTGYSNTVTIAEPGTLTITAVNRTDIVCYGGTGSIQMTASGGNGSYVYEMSTDNGTSWNAFTAATALPAASYQLKVSDAKGCRTLYNQTVDITTPANPLAINYTLTNYNGFNVPCYGSTNGVVQLQATGGNGSTYTGYTFAVDNGAYSATTPVTTGAGTHTFSVQDARGCVVNTFATLTQPAAQMQVTISSQRNNDCAGGKAGEVTVATSGGTPQYSFSIDGTTFQPSPVFSALVSGSYQVLSRDVNGCTNTVPVTIVDLNAPITSVAAISNVLCYNGNDGQISLTPGGGVAPYNYAWKNSTVTGNVLSNLPVGSYAVTITDSKGCNYTASYTVAQPLQPLSATTVARPVCVNNPFGNIIFYAQGGTAPYVYSINGGTAYSSTMQFNNIAAGSYPVTVKDANGCTWAGNATIAVNGTNPTLNFLVSTNQNALDTLQVLEVCTPKPDSIQWTFDASAQIIDHNMFSPLIKYPKEGSYPVIMKAWFGGCDFTTSKVITINPYDPNVVNNYNNHYGIDTVVAAPNPNTGNFTLKVKLFKKQRLLVKIYSVAGMLLWNKQWDYTSEVSEAVSLPSNVGNGLVFIKVLTDDDARDVPIMIAK